jgi:hypothetical protein
MKGKNDDSPDPESPPLRSIAAAPDPFPWSLATAVAARSQWGDWFESRDGEGEEEDYTTRATACNMQKGPPRLELVRLFASTSGMQVGEGDWAFYGGAWGREAKESLEYSYVACASANHTQVGVGVDSF